MKISLPWCQRSEIIQRNPDGSFDAELEIGFKFLVESYVSHVELNKSKSVKTTSSQSSLFDHLINIWEFNPGPVPGTCNLYFLVDFKFQSPLYRQMANMFFKEVVSRLVGSFNDRCRLIYGPGVTVLEHTYEQRA
ncbi:Polyketide cyclase/dehydrase and lipid transport protein [Forsythia ovata]|uniref:Polyketide cyclase/dehydrase and lipid transport protein n=1 Tax=Forsythia ovata TaxID=205694 RepID=A0ABD1U8Q2_9LAMI